MSQDGNKGAWVGDLDRFFRYDFRSIYEIEAEDEAEIERLELELDQIGDLELLAGKTISADQLYKKNIAPSRWRHALHLAEMVIQGNWLSDDLYSAETRFVKKMLDLGRPYAIARYARWESLDYLAALTATLPNGIRALVNQLLAKENIPRTRDADASILAVMRRSEKGDLIAYRRTGLLQTTIYRIADRTPTHPGGTKLNRNRMRTMLSLARLYFSTIELRLSSIEELRTLLTIYEAERAVAQRDNSRLTTNGRLIPAWRLRHVRSLLSFYPSKYITLRIVALSI